MPDWMKLFYYNWFVIPKVKILRQNAELYLEQPDDWQKPHVTEQQKKIMEFIDAYQTTEKT